MSLTTDSSPEWSPFASEPSTPGTESNLLFDISHSDASIRKHILVTGGLGFIGSHTTLELLKAGYNVVIVDDLSNSYAAVFERILAAADSHVSEYGGKRPEAVCHHISYQDITAISKILGSYRVADTVSGGWRSSITGVIHFASFKAVEESIRQPLRYYRNNVNGLVDFLSLLDHYNIKNFVFSSSAAVYGSLADSSTLLREEQVAHKVETYVDSAGTRTEVHPGSTGITCPYGRTKYFGEAVLYDLATSDPTWNIMCLRYFNPIGCDASGYLGEDPKGTPSNLVPAIVKVLIGQWPHLAVFGTDWETPDGSAIRDFVHVSDLARGHIAALATLGDKGSEGNYRTINLGTGAGHSVLEVVAAVESASGHHVTLQMSDRRPGDVQHSVAATDRATNELGWRSKETLADACRDLWHFLTINNEV